MRRIRGRKALVTGAASGIGRALALALAREGADLFLLDIDAAKLAATAREAESLGVAVVARPCDLAQPAEISAAVEALRASFGGRLHILVNNAGLVYYGRTDEMSLEQCRRILSVNLLAPIALVLAFIPLLMAQDEAHILNVGSIFGLTTFRKGAAYQASKFGLVGFSAALRAEYVRQGIGVTALCPGFVRTPMLESYATGASQPTRRDVPGWACMSPERVAAAAMRAIRRNRALVVVPVAARLLWWLTRLSPALVGWLLREGWRPSRRAKAATE
jgi:3-oxoacyl-[acyl-carrier protein] reductase